MTVVIASNQATAALRRIPFTLVDATDLVTPEDITVTGVKVSLNIAGGTPANSTNDIVKVAGATGEYYLELTQAESNQTAGTFIRGTLTPTGCALTKVQAQIGGANLFAATVDSNVVSLAAGVITAASIAADAITDAKVASDVTIASVTGAVGSVTGAVGSVTGAVGSVTGAVGSVTGNVGGNVVGTVGTVNAIAANAITAAATAADFGTEIAAAVLAAAAADPIDANVEQFNAVTITGDGVSPKFGV